MQLKEGTNAVPLIGGYYQARSLIAGAQRCLNLYPERNQADSDFPYTHYLTPGLTSLATGTGQWRCLYMASNGKLYGVRGGTVYYITSAWALTSLGTITTSTGPVSMSDNELVVVIVDGSASGSIITMATNVLTAIVDAAFYGATKVDYLDTFFIFDKPATDIFYISPSLWDGIVAFDPLDFASKTSTSDLLSTLVVNNRIIWLLGAQKGSENWYNVGKPDFTFERMPGVIVNHGCAAAYSVAQFDAAIFWLGIDPQGRLFVLRGENYTAKVVTTAAVSAAMSAYTTTSDAIGFIYQQGGHPFYVLIFPTEDKTWVYDLSENLWHERCWSDSDGNEHRVRWNCVANAYGKIVAGDWEDGTLYEVSLTTYTDNADPIKRRRVFPNLKIVGDRVFYPNVIVDMQVGGSTAGLLTSDAPRISIETSDTRGYSWGNPVTVSVGADGEYLTSVQINQTGMARDRVFALEWDFPYPTALNGLYVEATKAKS